MVERYAREEMKSKWTMQAKYQAWLVVEVAVVKAWNRLGLIPTEDADKIVKKLLGRIFLKRNSKSL